jgi:hypothetical protein
VTDLEFCLNVAGALLPDLEKAAVFISRALAETVDPRLRSLLIPALSAIEQNDPEAAARWLDRAMNYGRSRRPSGDA